MIQFMISLLLFCVSTSVVAEKQQVVITVLFQDSSPKWKRKLMAYVVKNDGTITHSEFTWSKGKKRLSLTLDATDADIIRFSAIESIEGVDDTSICAHVPREKIRIRYGHKIYTNKNITVKDAWCEFHLQSQQPSIPLRRD